MKKTLLILLLCIPIGALAQKTSFDSLYVNYTGKAGYTTIEISGELIKMLGSESADGKNDKSLSETIDGIKHIRIIAEEKPSSKFNGEILSISYSGRYKLLTSITENDGKKLSFFFREGGNGKNALSEFLMVMLSENGNMFMSITGKIDVKKISKLSTIKISGFDKLKRVDK